MEPKGYFDPPSEREWTIEEMEEFFAGQDVFTGLLNGATWTNSAPVKETGIHVTRIDPSAQGWPVAMHCPICKETTFILSPWAVKPSDGDYHLMEDVCSNPEAETHHNIQLALDSVHWKRILKDPYDGI